ncbi:MAG: dUTP diphosphatase [Candidatus Zixiibacteriota bacterium]
MASEKVEIGKVKIGIELLYDEGQLPVKMSENAAGYDIRAALSRPVRLSPGERELIPTGFSIEIPIGYEAQIRPRSGLAIRYGITCLNSPGTIDSDYRGEVMVVLANLGQIEFIIEPGQRIAQMIIQKLPEVEIIEKKKLSETGRGDGGFGSTGIS